MKFYIGRKIGKGNRISLRLFFQPNTKVVIWVENPHYDLVRIKTYLGLTNEKDIPKYAIHSVDGKGRVSIPSDFRRNANYAFIAKDSVSGDVVLKLLHEELKVVEETTEVEFTEVDSEDTDESSK